MTTRKRTALDKAIRRYHATYRAYRAARDAAAPFVRGGPDLTKAWRRSNTAHAALEKAGRAVDALRDND